MRPWTTGDDGALKRALRWRRVLLAMALVLSLLPSARAAAGDSDLLVLRAKGHAEGTGVAARRNAAADAVRKVMREVLVKKAHTEDLTLLRPIMRFANRYVARYDVLRVDEREESTGVEADIYLHDRDIDRDIARIMLPYLPRRPKLFLLMGEKADPKRDLVVPDLGIAETTLRDGLKGLNLAVTGSDSIAGLYTQRQLVDVVKGGASTGARFAMERESDVVVVGEASITREKTAGSGEVMRSVARINLRIFRSFDGDMIYDLSSRAAVYGEDLADAAEQALEDAALKLVGDTAMAAVLAVLGRSMHGSDHVTLTLENPRTEARVTALVTALRDAPEVTLAKTLFYSENTARVQLGYGGPMSVLSRLLDGCEVEGRTLKIRSVVGREITARFE